MNKELLNRISKLLTSGAWNYTVFLDFLELEYRLNALPSEYISAAFGKEAAIAKLKIVDAKSVLINLENCLSYTGGGLSDHGPSPATLASNEFKLCLQQLSQATTILANNSIELWQFQLGEGHPAYPVFWDFAYLFISKSGAKILIGSSSD